MKSLKSEQFVYLRHFSLMFKVFRHNGRQHIYFNCFYGFFVSDRRPSLVFFTVLWCTEYFNSFFTVLFYYYLLFLVF